MAFIEVKNVSKSYEGHQALRDLSFTIEKGSIYGLLGPNGSGKTTFIRILNRIITFDSGEIFFNGSLLKQEHVEKIGYLPEERGLYKKMKVAEQVIYFAQLKGLTYTEALHRTKKLLKKFDMLSWWNKKLEELSKGMQQKVQFLITIIHDPDLLIFDEPFSGFDPLNQEMLKHEILELNRQGKTILFSTHMMAAVEEVCDSILLINNGEKILEGKINDIKQKFKQNKFKIIFKNKETKFLSSNSFIVEKKANGEYLVQIVDGSSSHQLLNYVLEFGDIVLFQELLPSLNEVFINVVKNSNTKVLKNE